MIINQSINQLKNIDYLILAYILDHAVCCSSASSSGRSLHLIISQLRKKYSSSNCPNHVRRTMSSVKKRGKVRRILRTTFGEGNVRPVKNGLNVSHLAWMPFFTCPVSTQYARCQTSSAEFSGVVRSCLTRSRSANTPFHTHTHTHLSLIHI